MTEKQHRLLHKHFNEYRDLLKLQYDRQLRQGEEYRAGYRMDLQGYGVQTRAPRGRWPDTWVSSDFSMEFTATTPAHALAGAARCCRGVRSARSACRSAGQRLDVSIHASTTWSPGGDTRELAYRVTNAALKH